MLQFLLDHEYIITLYYALALFLFFMPKRKYFYIPLVISFLGIETYWHFRPLPGPFDYLMVYLFMGISLFAILKCDIFRNTFVLTLTFCVQHIAYKTTIILLMLTNPFLRGEWPYFLLMLTFTTLVNLGIYFIFLRKTKNSELMINNYYLFLVAFLILTAAIVVSYFVEAPLIEMERYGLMSLVNVYAILTSLGGIFILFISAKETTLENEKKLLEIILKNDEKRYEIAKVAQEQINIKYHDLKHFIHENKMSEEEIVEIEENGKIFKSIYYTGNKALDVVLIEKNMYCLKNNIHFLSIADGKLLDFMSTTHIYSMFSNLIDNAIESELKIKDEKLRLIRLNVSKQRNSVVVSVENACFEEPQFEDDLPITSKADKLNHGFGTKSIKNITNKYNGMLSFTWKDNIFYAKIVFPLQSNN